MGNAKVKKIRFAINAEEGVEKREHLYMVGRHVNWCNNYTKQYEVSLKTESGATVIPYHIATSSNPTTGHTSGKDGNSN